MPASQPPTLYTTRQLADAAGLSYKRTLQLVRQYQLGTMYGPTRLFTPDDLEIVTHRPDRRAIGLTNSWPAPVDDDAL